MQTVDLAGLNNVDGRIGKNFHSQWHSYRKLIRIGSLRVQNPYENSLCCRLTIGKVCYSVGATRRGRTGGDDSDGTERTPSRDGWHVVRQQQVDIERRGYCIRKFRAHIVIRWS